MILQLKTLEAWVRKAFYMWRSMVESTLIVLSREGGGAMSGILGGVGGGAGVIIKSEPFRLQRQTNQGEVIGNGILWSWLVLI